MKKIAHSSKQNTINGKDVAEKSFSIRFFMKLEIHTVSPSTVCKLEQYLKVVTLTGLYFPYFEFGLGFFQNRYLQSRGTFIDSETQN